MWGMRLESAFSTAEARAGCVVFERAAAGYHEHDDGTGEVFAEENRGGDR